MTVISVIVGSTEQVDGAEFVGLTVLAPRGP